MRPAPALAAAALSLAACSASPGGRPDTAARGSDTPAAVAGSARDTADTIGRGRAGAAAGGAGDPGPPAPPGRPPGAVAPPGAGAPSADTLRGTVAVVGADPLMQVVVHPTGGGAPVTLTGDMAPGVGSLAGAEVWVEGARTGPSRMEVRRFAVRAVDGVPAVDGVLESDGGALVLVTAAGRRHRLVSPPAALRAHVGRRVWVSGDLAREPQAFGVIARH